MISDGAPPDLRSRSLALFERNFPYALALLDAEFQILWVSNGYTCLLGYANADVVGSNVFDFVHPDDLYQLLPMATQMVSVAAASFAAPSVSGMVELPPACGPRPGRGYRWRSPVVCSTRPDPSLYVCVSLWTVTPWTPCSTVWAATLRSTPPPPRS